jgi:hydroxyquinol 1,2-dioxygenase
MLVDAINHPLPMGATETTVLGPFYVDEPPELPLGADISGSEEGKTLLYPIPENVTRSGIPESAWL